MNAKKGLARVDVVVAAACLAFVLANVQVIIAGGRERSKREVCLANLRALTTAWTMHANDNDGKIPSGDVWYSWTFPSGSSGGPQGGWYEWPHYWPHGPQTPAVMQTNPSTPYPYKVADWQHSIAEGLLWKYIRDYNIYRCPSGGRNEYVTYTMAFSMNTWPGAGGPSAPVITNINQITQPAERVVFIDVGAAGRGAFYVRYGDNPLKWYTFPPMRHDQGTTFTFVDGHAIYRKWTDPHTLDCTPDKYGWGTQPGDNCDCDLRWIVKAIWGKLSFEWEPCPDKNCPD
jgi:prepilin-type processing-associated H-X9-DG protein